MAPFLDSQGSAIDSNASIDLLKEKVGASDLKLEATAKPPVADDFMYDFKYNHPLPTPKALGIEIPVDTDAQAEAEAIKSKLSEIFAQRDAKRFSELFLDCGAFLSRFFLSSLCLCLFPLSSTYLAFSNLTPFKECGETSSLLRGTIALSISSLRSSRLPPTSFPPSRSATLGS